MESTLEIADTSSFGGDITVDANVFVHGESFVMYSDPSTSQVILHNNGDSSFSGNMEIHDINCRNTLDGFNSFRMIDGSTTKASINKLGESSFLGKMQINDELVVQGHSSFVTTMNVGGTSSFGDVMTVNSTSSFIDDVTLGTGADLIMNSTNFKMIDSGIQKVLIGNNGNASFSGNMEIADINCRNTLDGFNSFRMIDGSTTNASINKIGESSFLGVMKIDNALNVDGITTIKDVGNDRIRLTPGTTTSDSKIEVLGSVSCWAAGFGGVVGHSENCKIDSNGNGSFSGTVTAGAVSTPSLTVSTTAYLNSTLSVTGVTTLGDALSGTSGSFNGALSGTTGSFSGALSGTTITSSDIITCNANKMVIAGDSPTLYLRDSDGRTGMIHQNASTMYFLSGVANSDLWVQTENDRWPLYIETTTNEAVFGGNIDAAVGTVTAAAFSGGSVSGTTGTFTEGISGNLEGDVEGNVTGQVSDISNHSTDQLVEGTSNNSNKYFTDARARDAISAGTGVSITTGEISIGQAVATNSSVTFASVTATTFNGALSGNADTAGSVTGQSSISKTAHASGADDYHLELYSGNTGDSNRDISIRFHQDGVSDGQIRFRGVQFYFTDGGDNSMYAVNTGALIATSVYTGGRVSGVEVYAAAFVTTSDRRIKSNVVDIHDTTALDQIRLLKPKYYDYVDKVKRGSSSVIGFIAQDVKEVLPRAVSVTDGDIPNIYETATISSNNTVTFTNFNTSNLEGLGKLITYPAEDKREELTITEVVDEHTVRVEEDLSEWGEQLFVWGQKVDDFHHLNKGYIFTVATAALQEVDRQLQAEKVKTYELQKKVELLEMSHGALVGRIEALEKL